MNFYKQQMVPWILASLLYFLVMGAVFGLLIGKTVMDIMAAGPRGVPPTPNLALQLIVTVVVSVVVTFFIAGLYRMGIKQIRGESIGIGDLFSVTDVLPALAQYMAFVAVFGVLSNLLSMVPFGGIISAVLQVAVAGLFVFAIPLIVDQRLSAIEALTRSFDSAKSQFVMIVLFLIVSGLVGILGVIACGIGAIFTLPISVLALCVLYRDFFPQNAVPAHPSTGYGAYPSTPSPPPVEPGLPPQG